MWNLSVNSLIDFSYLLGFLRFLSGIFEVDGTAAVNGPTNWTSGLVKVNSGATFYLNGPVKKGPTARETVSGTMSQLPSGNTNPFFICCKVLLIM